MTHHNHTLGGLLYILERASKATNRDTLAAYAEQTDKALTSHFLSIDVSETTSEAAVMHLYDLLAAVRACKVLSRHARSDTLLDVGRIIRKLAANANVTHAV